MRIALDAMGGDRAPGEIVKGAIEGARENGVEVVLVGPTGIVRAELEKHAPLGPGLEMVEAPEVVRMDEAPAMAVRQKKHSSLVVGMRLVKAGEASAFISAGNSGAVMAAALLILGLEEGVERPALATAFPTPAGPVLFLDVGANTDCKPSYLLQFAHMGNSYMKKVFGIANPRISLLSNGEEEIKGNQLVREAHALLKTSGLNFVGNIEGKDVAHGVADVVVTDGFTGNVMVKVTEGVYEMLAAVLEQEAARGAHMALAISLFRPLLQTVAKRLDYTQYGGAPLLGIRGNVIIGHGRSDARAIKSALRMAKTMVEQEGKASVSTSVPDREAQDIATEYPTDGP
jgi:glycerol-3-phosphate acyltransferase PlsX